ncbi:MAG: glycerophosphodiester phosphodiesterase [Acidimicrobiia bacterium]|nr:glycerophosphodiester phosphodiesterase [Acidimicrobiia bacterium]
MTDVIAHRGASRAERENTVAAFRRAVEMGADAVELDVRRTADGLLVVSHDPVVDERIIVATDAADLPEHVATLAEALDACSGLRVNVEIKNDAAEPDHDPDDLVADLVVAALEASGRDPTSLLISSFRLATVDRCRAVDPAVPTAWLVLAVADHVPAMLVERGHAAVHPWVGSVDEALVRRCHDLGLQVNVWTCNDAEQAAVLAGWGVDGICTDVPDVLLDRLRT